jgi:ArsR family transcriptional regulator, arsenate/arsenite/antimonite-responsive transcriptional repressor
LLPVLPTGACCGLAVAPLDEADATRIAGMFKALGDPVRLRLAAMIAAQDQICVCDLTPHFEVSGATISHHLKVLREAGLVDCERRGTWVHYWVKPDALESLSVLLRSVPS